MAIKSGLMTERTGSTERGEKCTAFKERVDLNDLKASMYQERAQAALALASLSSSATVLNIRQVASQRARAFWS